jgi:hypothetical protein
MGRGLGGGVFKQRIARDGDGKSGSFRAILLFRIGEHSFFVHGFAKRDKANITTKELVALKKLADEFFAFSAETLARVCAAGEITEITDSHGKGEQDA